MKIKVYNSNQIGGCFTVIESEKAKILIDYGLALPGTDSEQQQIDFEKEEIDAVFFTHYHGDHIGRILEIPEKITLYMGDVTKRILLNVHETLSKIPDNEESKEKVKLLKSEHIRTVKVNKAIKINDIIVTPYSVDHSAYDAYMYLIEADGEVALHTGDFREHGYRGKALPDVIDKYIHKDCRKVDYLIIEGTMIGERQNEKVMTEYDLQREAKELFKENKYVFLAVSSTNLDSLASFYQAAYNNDMWLYCDNYRKKQLKTFSDTAGKYTDLYKFKKVHNIEFNKKLEHQHWDRPKTQEEVMREKGFLCLITPCDKCKEWIERFKDKNPLIIYSMWDGYIDSENKNACIPEWIDFYKEYIDSGRFKKLHTSGHATPETIKMVIEKVDPQKAIIPMHTEFADGFKNLGLDKKYERIIRND